MGSSGGRSSYDKLRMSGQLRCGKFGDRRRGSGLVAGKEWVPAFAGMGEGWLLQRFFLSAGFCFFLWWKQMLFSFVNWDLLIAVVEV